MLIVESVFMWDIEGFVDLCFDVENIGEEYKTTSMNLSQFILISPTIPLMTSN